MFSFSSADEQLHDIHTAQVSLLTLVKCQLHDYATVDNAAICHNDASSMSSTVRMQMQRINFLRVKHIGDPIMIGQLDVVVKLSAPMT